MSEPIPRWQQGFRPYSYENVWLRMTPAQRRNAFIGDMVILALSLGIFAVFVIASVSSIEEFDRIMSPVLGVIAAGLGFLGFMNWVVDPRIDRPERD